MIHAHIGQRGGDRQGMGNVGMPSAAHLASVGNGRVFVSFAYQVEILWIQVDLQLCQQRGDARGGCNVIRIDNR